MSSTISFRLNMAGVSADLLGEIHNLLVNHFNADSNAPIVSPTTRANVLDYNKGNATLYLTVYPDIAHVKAAADMRK